MGLSSTFSYRDETALRGWRWCQFITAAPTKQERPQEATGRQSVDLRGATKWFMWLTQGCMTNMCAKMYKNILSMYLINRCSYLSTPPSSPGCSSVAAGRQSFLRPPCCRSDRDPLALSLDPDHYDDHRGSRSLHSALQHPPRCYPPETEREELD